MKKLLFKVRRLFYCPVCQPHKFGEKALQGWQIDRLRGFFNKCTECGRSLAQIR